MKATINDHRAIFEIVLEPESMEEIAQLIRFKLNARKIVSGIYCSAYRDKTVRAGFFVGHRKDDINQIGE
uniref:Uncharacterized protein n=1 Tax=viral metagenome TaxID=1070528 RepID=A0A6M3LJU8_9ZZZZ